MISVTHFASDDPTFAGRAQRALEALAQRPGYLRGSLGRGADDPATWLLVTEWANVGSFRRALGNYEVKLHATPLLAEAIDVPTAFEPLLEIAPGGAALARTSDRTSDRNPEL